MGPSAQARVAEVMSGRAWSQQGLATTCKDSGPTETGGPERDKVWRVSPYEQGRRGNALRGDPRGRPDGGLVGQRGSGHSAAVAALAPPDSELDSGGQCSAAKGRSQLFSARVGASQRIARRRRGKACPDKWRAEPRPEPDSGQPTVRDRRGASGDVAHGGTRTPPRNRKGESGNAPPTGARAWDLSRHPHARIRGGTGRQRPVLPDRHFLAVGPVAGLAGRVPKPAGAALLIPTPGPPQCDPARVARARPRAVALPAVAAAAQEEELLAIRPHTDDQPQRIHALPRSGRGGWTSTLRCAKKGAATRALPRV